MVDLQSQSKSLDIKLGFGEFYSISISCNFIRNLSICFFLTNSDNFITREYSGVAESCMETRQLQSES